MRLLSGLRVWMLSAFWTRVEEVGVSETWLGTHV